MTQNGQLSPAELAPIAQGQLANEAAAAWNAMNVEARKRGLELVPTGSMSSYRTLAQQRILYARYQAGGNEAADPGTSNHGWGVAVDVPTIEMRTLIDHIGVQFGWSKAWSDAPGEWWHIKYQPGHYSGPDPGPYGQPAIPEPPEGTVAIHAVVKQNGAIEVFVETSSGEVLHTWQTGPNTSWWGAEKGKRNAAWQTLGTPGK